MTDAVGADPAGQTGAAGAAGAAGRDEAESAVQAPARVFISYAHDDAEHEERVHAFWLFLRAQGIDARLDRLGEERRDWAQWMTRQIRDADRVLVIASPEYRRRAEGDAEPDEGRGVQWEARLIRERCFRDQTAGLQWAVPVVLPGGAVDDIPLWLFPTTVTHYLVSEYTVVGAEELLRLLTGQPGEAEPALGTVPVLSPHGGQRLVAASAGPGLRTEVVIEASISADGKLESAVWAAGSLLGRRQERLPAEVDGVWRARELPAIAAGDRLADAGRRLAGALLDEAGQRLLGGLLGRLAPGSTAEVVLIADGPALSLPVELIRLTESTGGEVGPLGLLPAVSVSRRAGHGRGRWHCAGFGRDRRAAEGAGGGRGPGRDQDAERAAGRRGRDAGGARSDQRRHRRPIRAGPGSWKWRRFLRSGMPWLTTPITCCICPRMARPTWWNSKTRTAPRCR